MIERRSFTRTTINLPALLSFDGIRGVYPCVVRDISASGARISAPYYIFAREFVLSFDGFGTGLNCRTVWRKGNLYGLSLMPRHRSPIGKAVRLDRRAVAQRVAGAPRWYEESWTGH